MHRTVSFRRWQEEKSKVRARKVMRLLWQIPEEFITPEAVGINAHSHCKPCSCYMCGNPRKHWHELTIQEMKANLAFIQQLKEIA